MIAKVTKDWWLATGVVEIAVGIIGIISRLSSGVVAGGIILGVIQIIFGIGLIQKSKIVFWLGFFVAASNLLQVLNGIAKGTMDTSGMYAWAILLVGIRFAFYVMIFQQIRKPIESKTKKVQRSKTR